MAENITMVEKPITGPTPKNSNGRKWESPVKVVSSKSELLSTQKKTSPSQKSVSASRSQAKYRLRRTLKRKPEFHKLEVKDLKYLWAAYRMGSFGEVEDISQDEFRNNIANYIDLTDVTFTLLAETKDGKIPVGIFSGNFNGPIFFIGSALWFKWASDRNKLESAVHALNELRKDYVVVMHNHMDDKKFYEVIAKHGVTRQVGRLFDVYEDCPAQEWQTRRR